MGEGSGTKMQDNPAFIRLEGKVDNLICAVQEYKVQVDKGYVSRTEFEVFKATINPTSKLINEIIKYVLLAVVAAGIALIFSKTI